MALNKCLLPVKNMMEEAIDKNKMKPMSILLRIFINSFYNLSYFKSTDFQQDKITSFNIFWHKLHEKLSKAERIIYFL